VKGSHVKPVEDFNLETRALLDEKKSYHPLAGSSSGDPAVTISR
jgi:hypothetical protein